MWLLKSHYLNQRWPSSVTLICAILGSWVNSYPPGPNGCHFANKIFKCIFMNKRLCTLIWISLKFVPKIRSDNKCTLVQVLAWRIIGDKPLSELMLTQFTEAHAALESDEFKQSGSTGLLFFKTVFFRIRSFCFVLEDLCDNGLTTITMGTELVLQMLMDC